jgi:hypothetical protein
MNFAALLISLIAGVYFGFAVMSGATRDQATEFIIAGFFVFAAMLGLVTSSAIIAGAYFGHAFWDLAHHDRAHLSLVAIPQWYIPWCVIIDVMVGTGLLVIWHVRGFL